MNEVTVSPSNKRNSYLSGTYPVDIEFKNLSCKIRNGKDVSKPILNGINGVFCSGELTAIMGTSGAGKTTLLNILSAYKCDGISGTILVNGAEMKAVKFRKMSRYLLQNSHIRPKFTVQESMEIAADLKFGSSESRITKLKKIEELLDLLGLSSTRDTICEHLSGGQAKRLAIAYELLNNPSVLFLDEPTTGLDDSASFQCVSLLKSLAEGGRTVICSLHTPSTRLFAMFDKVYVVDEGQCVYQGYGPSSVPFLSRIGLDCPISYSPSDFMIEVCNKEYGDYHDVLVSLSQNGTNTTYFKAETRKKLTNEQVKYKYKDFEKDKSTFSYQVMVLTLRFFTQFWRDKTLLGSALVAAFFGLVIGNLCLGTGNDGSKYLFNFGYFYMTLVTLMYFPTAAITIWFPQEYDSLKREYLNQWYGLSSYFVALTIANIPNMLVMTGFYVGISYVLTDQPFEFERFLMFYVISMFVFLTSESLALIVATSFNAVESSFLAISMNMPLTLLAVYGMGCGKITIPVWIQISMYLNHLRYCLSAFVIAMLKNRETFPCPEEEEWCVSDVNFIIESTGMERSILWIDFLACICFLLIFKSIAFYTLKQRLAPSRKVTLIVNIVKTFGEKLFQKSNG